MRNIHAPKVWQNLHQKSTETLINSLYSENIFRSSKLSIIIQSLKINTESVFVFLMINSMPCHKDMKLFLIGLLVLYSKYLPHLNSRNRLAVHTLLAVKLKVLVSLGSFGRLSIVLSSNTLLAPLLMKSCGGMLSSEEGSSG